MQPYQDYCMYACTTCIDHALYACTMIVDIIYVFKRRMGDTLPQKEGIETLQAPYAGTEGR